MLHRLGLIVVMLALWSCGSAKPPTPQLTPEGIEITLSSETKL